MKILKTNKNMSKILLFISLIIVTFFTYFFIKIGFFFLNIGYNSLFYIDNFQENASEYNILAKYIVENDITEDDTCQISKCTIGGNKDIYQVMKDLKIKSFLQKKGEIILLHTRYFKGNSDNRLFYSEGLFTDDVNKNISYGPAPI